MPIQVTRGGITESTHEVDIVVMSAKGLMTAWHGDPMFTTFARSSMKPIQAIPLVESGALESFHCDEADLAQCCASHSSEMMHLERVANMLLRIGLDESHLQCGGHQPHSEETFFQLIRSGQKPTSLYSNCSGKHTGMLMYCRQMGVPIESYHQLQHPLQQEIMGILAELAEVSPDQLVIGVDGCGVPAFALSLTEWARAFSKFADPTQSVHGEAMQRISHAMRTYPELVGGTGRFDTNLMLATDGRLMAKGGAEGFFLVIDTERQLTIVAKTRDGNARAIQPAVLKTLLDLSILSEAEQAALEQYEHPKLFNTRQELVGEIIADFELTIQ
ncbi:MAG: asparaginase [Acidibacillus sp.]|nr:asparaginase [Acidibacillus sp.]